MLREGKFVLARADQHRRLERVAGGHVGHGEETFFEWQEGEFAGTDPSSPIGLAGT